MSSVRGSGASKSRVRGRVSPAVDPTSTVRTADHASEALFISAESQPAKSVATVAQTVNPQQSAPADINGNAAAHVGAGVPETAPRTLGPWLRPRGVVTIHGDN